MMMTPLAGQTIDQANIRNIPSVTLVALERDGVINRAVGPDETLEAGDMLWFVGEREGLASLRLVAGLEDADAQQVWLWI